MHLHGPVDRGAVVAARIARIAPRSLGLRNNYGKRETINEGGEGEAEHVNNKCSGHIKLAAIGRETLVISAHKISLEGQIRSALSI